LKTIHKIACTVDLFAIELVAIVVKIEFRDFKRTYYLGRREWPN